MPAHMRARVVMLAPAFALALAGTARAATTSGETLGPLEREAVDDVLVARQRAVDPAPEGKTIHDIMVVNLPVFSRRDWYFQIFNVLHVTTRTRTILNELLFRPGQRYDPDVVDESARNLRADPSYSSVVAVVPLATGVPGTVDVLVVTRDVWSLRLNTDFDIQQGRLVFLTTSLAENNLLGRRKRLALVFTIDQGAMALGPTYYDPNIAGTRFNLAGSAQVLFRRDGGNLEGSTSSLTFGYPLFSLATPWSAGFSVGHTDGVSRAFTGNDLAQVDLKATPDIQERLPWEYRVRSFGFSEGVVRQLGRVVIHRLSAGHEYSVVRPSFTPEFPDDPVERAEFAREKFPRSERVSDLYAGYSLFTPRYRAYRNLNSFDLREDVQLGPSASGKVSRAARVLGSERDFYRLNASAGWNFAALDGYESVGVSWGGRLDGGRLIDHTYSVGVYLASPVLRRVVRLVGSAGVAVRLDDTQNAYYAVGGDSGLRGYTIGDRRGQTRALAHLEARTMPLPVWSFRVGGVLFGDVGDAGPSDNGPGDTLGRLVRSVRALALTPDVGFGMRLLIPQLNSYVMRLDWGFPLVASPRTPAGWPGRVNLTFRQFF
jgi:outer membrane protein assembly factor BamA